jgi:hypothetical protein
MFGCKDSGDNKLKNKKVVTSYNMEVCNVINTCIKNCTPVNEIKAKYDNLGSSANLTLFVSEVLFLLEQKTIDTLINLKASTLLNAAILKPSAPENFNIQYLKNLNEIKVSVIPPLTSEEGEKNIGKIVFSRICFNKERTKAACIFEFTNVSQNKRIFALELVKNENWKIIKKIDISNLDDFSMYISNTNNF